MKKILVETSARHVHLTEEQFHKLFGDDKELTVKKYLSQPGQYVSNEKVNLIGPKKSINNVSILGPYRKAAQVEISLTDSRTLASGMANAKKLLDDIKAGKSEYHFIEIMCCPGGCINGGGQPYVKPVFLNKEGMDILDTYREKRASVLYKEDKGRPIRQSHNNPQIKKLYEDYFKEPLSEKSEELLHTHYKARERYPEI